MLEFSSTVLPALSLYPADCPGKQAIKNGCLSITDIYKTQDCLRATSALCWQHNCPQLTNDNDSQTSFPVVSYFKQVLIDQFI